MAKEEQKSGRSSLNLSSKFMKTALIILTVFLIFAGPTYVVYVLLHVLELNYLISMGFGFALFIIGLVFLLYLFKKEALS